MGSGGHNKLTKAQKIAKGTYNVTRDGGQTEVVVGGIIKTIPNAPEGLSDRAANVWEQLCNDLIVAQLLQTVDLYQIEILCNTLDRYWPLNDWIAKKTEADLDLMDKEKFSKWAFHNRTAKSLLDTINTLCRAFGLNPSARRGLIVEQKEVTKDATLELMGS